MKKGYASSRLDYEIDPKTGKLIHYDIPADAVTPEAKPGFKSGIPFIDDMNEEQYRSDLIEIIKKMSDLENI